MGWHMAHCWHLTSHSPPPSALPVPPALLKGLKTRAAALERLYAADAAADDGAGSLDLAYQLHVAPRRPPGMPDDRDDSMSDSGEDRGLPTASVNPAGRQSLLRSQSEPRGATVALRSQSVNPAGQQSLCEARA